MKKIYFLVVMCLLVVTAIAQKPTATFKKVPATLVPTIDAVADDDLWAAVAPISCDSSYYNELPTCTVTWQAAWDDDNIYLFITILDDVFLPPKLSGLAGWQSDKPEAYFDVNAVLVDYGGPAATDGHHQLNIEMPPPYDTSGTVTSNGTLKGNASLTFDFASHIDAANEYWEFAIAHNTIKDAAGVAVNPSAEPTIGFDVYFIDTDTTVAGVMNSHRRKVWADTGIPKTDTIGNEAWSLMDDCGEVTFSNASVITGINTPVEDQGMITPTLVTDVINVPDFVTDLAIYNAVGQLVMKVNVTSPVINVADLNKGVYFVKMQVKGKSFTTRIFKQ